MATSKEYAYYIKGNKIAIIEQGIGSGVCSLSGYSNQTTCEAAGGTWQVMYQRTTEEQASAELHYYSGDGTVSKNSVDVTSASYKLIEGISMLLTRFGIYSKISTTYMKSNNFGTKNIAPVNRLYIRSLFARKFANTFTMTHFLRK